MHRRAKKAIEVDPLLLDEADKLKLELEEEKRENERLAKLEEERVEREAATEELQGAITAAKESRDASTLSKPIKRAKKVRFGVPGSGGRYERCVGLPTPRSPRSTRAQTSSRCD